MRWWTLVGLVCGFGLAWMAPDLLGPKLDESHILARLERCERRLDVLERRG